MSLGHGPKIATNGLVLAFDAANKKSYPGTGTVWNDISGNGNSGTFISGPVFDGANLGSIVLDGNSYVDTAFSFSARPFSINCWLYFNSLSIWQTFVGQDSSDDTPFGAIYFGKTTDSEFIPPRINNTFGISMVNSLGEEVYCYDPIPVSTAVWYNYCVSVSLGDLKLYKNGQLVATTVNSNNMATPTGTAKIGVGYYGDELVDYVNGGSSQVCIYNRALLANEVAQNFDALRGRYGI